MNMQNVKPRYEVERVDDTVVEKHIKRVDGRNVESEVEVPYGYNVYFPAGHSIRVRTDAELARLGFDQPAELVNEEGEVVGTTKTMSLKKNVQRRAGASTRADTGSTDANQGG